MFSQKLQSDLMEQWADTQKETMNMWQDAFKFETKGSSINNPVNFLKEWPDFNKDIFGNQMKLWGGNGSKEVFEAVTNGINVYSDLYRFWKDLNEKINAESTIKQIKEFNNEWFDKYMEIFSEQFLYPLPKFIQELFDDSGASNNSYINFIKKLHAPLNESYEEFQETFKDNPFFDRETIMEYTEQWKETYDETFGELFQTPFMGMSESYSERLVDNTDTFIDYVNNYNELMATTYETAADVMEEIVEDYQAMLEDDLQFETFKGFYDYWLEKNQKTFKKLFDSEEFSEIKNKINETSIKFKEDYNNFIKKQIEVSPFFPNVDELNDTIDSLKDQIDSLNKKVEEIEGK
ncbi:poly(R)-hydroxyalkanoic acid synthase subunit PhaE [Natroniella sp. ANB-PHB2]|uniref:poly(R)-hydroxyalkanoic acid synthase subunit PhaE n=1 Tax=Natroniella sp. ANB-PHB2 TaxID=3384444 RepID=UPI0038D41F98